jgi:hypothetical protein
MNTPTDLATPAGLRFPADADGAPVTRRLRTM